MTKVMYCEKCGKTGHVLFSKKCKNCNLNMKLLSEEMKYKYHIFVEDWAKISNEEIIKRENNFVMSELKDNPLFSMEEYEKQIECFSQRLNNLEEHRKQQQLEQQNKNIARMQKELNSQNYIPKCPVCGSSSIKIISITTRVIKTAAFGVVGAIDDAGKTYQCNNCKSKF